MAFWATCKIAQPIQPIWQHIFALPWSALKKPPWEFNFFHIFGIPSSSRHEKRCQMLQTLFWLFQYSKNPRCTMTEKYDKISVLQSNINNHWDWNYDIHFITFRLKDISTSDFSTSSFNPRSFNPWLFNHELSNPGFFNNELSNPKLFNPRLFNHELFNPRLLNPGVSNPNYGVEKSGVGKFMVEKSRVEKSGVEKSGVEMFTQSL